MTGINKYQRTILLLVLLLAGSACICPGLPAQDLQRESIRILTDRDIYIAGEEIFFKIFTRDGETGEPLQLSDIAYVEMLDRQNSPLVQGKFLLRGGEVDGKLMLPIEIPSDHYILRAYTSWTKNSGANSYAYRGITAINPYEELRTDMLLGKNADPVVSPPNDPVSSAIQTGIYVRPDRQWYGTRQKVRLGIEVRDEKGDPLDFRVALSLVRPGLTYLSDPGFKLPVQGKSIGGGDRIPPEWGGHYIRGNISGRTGGKPFAGDTLLISVTGKIPFLDYTKSDEEGNFNYLLPHYSGSREIVIQNINPTRNDYQITLEDMFSSEFPDMELPDFYLDTTRLEEINQAVINAQVRSLYMQEQRNVNGLLGPSRPFYGKPDEELFLADYIKLPEMREVFFELMSSAQIHGTGNDIKVRLKDLATGDFFKEQPMLLVDGVVTHDPVHIEQLNPLKAERIDLVKNKYYLGNLYIPGIISVITQDGSCPLDFPAYFFRQSYNFISSAAIPVFPVYDTDTLLNRPVPDFRNTLYWNPGISPGKDGETKVEFYTSDDEAEYTLVIEGYASDGTPISYRTSFTVQSR